MRLFSRAHDQLRPIVLEPHAAKHAEGSCLVRFGDTHVLCTASIDEKVPPFLKGSGAGWITAEYGMLPRATHTRMEREAAKGKQSGRTQEIQRLIGRSLRMAVSLSDLGERQIKIDCDVLQADGGTRTAAITGGYVALTLACRGLLSSGAVKHDPIRRAVAAVSCGIVAGEARLDLDYAEDSTAHADANFVLASNGQLIEVQATAEKEGFTPDQLQELLALAQRGCAQLFAEQERVLAV